MDQSFYSIELIQVYVIGDLIQIRQRGLSPDNAQGDIP
jgi:hypothetical protein